METRTRKPFEGIGNIIRFNWHFYAVATVMLVVLLVAANHTLDYTKTFLQTAFFLLLLSVFLSLAVSFYVCDLSRLYTLNWLPGMQPDDDLKLVNINAGFDETSYLLENKYPGIQLTVFDFYNAEHHTEISIARARKRYPPHSDTITISTSSLPIANDDSDAVFAILSAHEIRSHQERVIFFTEIKNKLKECGTVIVAEHLRDAFNFMAYNIGFFHFFSAKEWKRTFDEAGLHMVNETSVTPFIRVFILRKHGVTL